MTTPASDPPADAVGSPRRYAGLVTRGIAFAADALVINVAAVIVELGAALIVSLLHLPHDLKSALVLVGGVVYVLWTIGYFVVFWSTTGQTPGSRMMQIRVVTTAGTPVGPVRGVVRCVGLVLSALPLFAGYVMILFDDRCRALHDRMAKTLVIDAPQASLAAARWARNRAAYTAHDAALQARSVRRT